MQDKVLSLMIQARNLMLPNVGDLKQYVFFIPCKVLLQFVKDLELQKLPLYKIFYNAGSSCVRVFVLWEEKGQLELFWFL